MCPGAVEWERLQDRYNQLVQQYISRLSKSGATTNELACADQCLWILFLRFLWDSGTEHVIFLCIFELLVLGQM